MTVLGTTTIYPTGIVKECPGEFSVETCDVPHSLRGKTTCNDDMTSSI